MKYFVAVCFFVLSGCATQPPAGESRCQLYQPPRGWCAYTD